MATMAFYGTRGKYIRALNYYQHNDKRILIKVKIYNSSRELTKMKMLHGSRSDQWLLRIIQNVRQGILSNEAKASGGIQNQVWHIRYFESYKQEGTIPFETGSW